MDDGVVVSITTEPIELGWAEKLLGPFDGALVAFAGAVRGLEAGKAVGGLQYEAYTEMAEDRMREIGLEAKRRWGLGAVLVVHRTGSLGVGEISVLVAASAPHRQEAFEGCRFLIDTVKETVAIWKKEIFADGTSMWAK